MHGYLLQFKGESGNTAPKATYRLISPPKAAPLALAVWLLESSSEKNQPFSLVLEQLLGPVLLSQSPCLTRKPLTNLLLKAFLCSFLTEQGMAGSSTAGGCLKHEQHCV